MADRLFSIFVMELQSADRNSPLINRAANSHNARLWNVKVKFGIRSVAVGPRINLRDVGEDALGAHLAPLSPFRSWQGCTTNTSGYDFSERTGNKVLNQSISISTPLISNELMVI